MKWLFVILMIIGGPASAQEVPLEVLCKNLPDFVSEDGVNHVPGAEGAVPADINPLNAAVANVINIPIDVMLAERFTSVRIPNDLELQPTVSMVSVHQDGRVEYNGQDVSGQAYSLCGKSTVIPVEEPESASQANGQQGDDVLKSPAEIVEIKEGIEGEILEGQYP